MAFSNVFKQLCNSALHENRRVQMIGVLLLPLCLARSPNEIRRCLDGKNYIFHEAADRPVDTGECCTGFSRDEDGNCVADIVEHTFPMSAVPRFAAAISLVLIAWILIIVFSMVIAYVTMMERNRKINRISTIDVQVPRKRLLKNSLPSTSLPVTI
ncbi:hypothetical protein TELCIR_02506 [Teladorsagia circumcincta]|uniref:Uncharacterized protein n=1 Tax=Teladorsagia circumcincta TaxID=45464 RepID=A0A2G9UZA1_TELCI|nr:hypothetical protein TELCIR_02506 [Teladorsagia circumcincta]